MNRKIKNRRGKTIAAAFALAVVIAFSLAGCGQKDNVSTSKGDQVKAFRAQTINGDKVTNRIFADSELTMVNVWATYCGPCINEMPDLGKISRAHDKSEFQIVGVVSDINEPNDITAKEIISRTKANYLHIVPSADLENGMLQGISAVPTTIFVDKDGNIVGEKYVGSRSMRDWESIINELIKSTATEETAQAKDVATKLSEQPSVACPSCSKCAAKFNRLQKMLNGDYE